MEVEVRAIVGKEIFEGLKRDGAIFFDGRISVVAREVLLGWASMEPCILFDSVGLSTYENMQRYVQDQAQ